MANKLEELVSLREKLTKVGREKLAKLFDDGTFIELGLFMKSDLEPFDVSKCSTEGVAIGKGLINGRLVYATASDSKVEQGAVSKMYTEKIMRCQEEAIKVGAPIIYIFDSEGVDLNEGIFALSGISKVIKNMAMLSAVVPQISIITGTCAGTMSVAAMSSDFTIMVEKKAKLFGSAYNTLLGAEENNVKEENFADASFHNETGACDIVAKDDADAINIAKELISYLPENNLERAEIVATSDDINRLCDNLNEMSDINVRTIITTVADNNKFLELKPNYAKNMITGFIRLSGRTVGVIGNDKSFKDGNLNFYALEKAEKFVRICDSFNIPLVSFADTDGFVHCMGNELKGVIRMAAKLTSTFANATIPLITLIVNRAVGVGYVVMGSKELGVDSVIAWPNAKIADFTSIAGANILYKNEICKAKDVESERKKYMALYEDTYMTPYIAASKGLVDDIIDPKTTRQILISNIEALETKFVAKKNKKHSNI